MKNRKYKIVSLFSGIGGFEEGIKKSTLDHKVVFSSEIDKNAQKSYSANFDNSTLHGDITKIDSCKIPNHDLLVAGFPCQTFSIAGKRNGFNDTRGTLFFDIVRILTEKQPKYILLENVKNLISHDKGNTILTILESLNSLGYTVDFTIINSLEAGLPQNRERTYIIGIKGQKSEEFYTDSRSAKINDLKLRLSKNNFQGFNFFKTLKYNNKQQYIVDILQENVSNKYAISNVSVESFLQENISSVNSSNFPKIIKLFDLPKDVWNDLERQRRVYSPQGISPTILARSDTTKILECNMSEKRIRKLTPIENMRVQGFPDDFINNIINAKTCDTQLYKQAGNAVSPPVITGIINHLKRYMVD